MCPGVVSAIKAGSCGVDISQGLMVELEGVKGLCPLTSRMCFVVVP